ncbi:unnamed protein product, partial [Clonostachys rhizophaga]
PDSALFCAETHDQYRRDWGSSATRWRLYPLESQSGEVLLPEEVSKSKSRRLHSYHTGLFCSSAASSPSGNVLALDSSLTLVAVKASEATVATNYVVRGFPRPYSIRFVAEANGLSHFVCSHFGIFRCLCHLATNLAHMSIEISGEHLIHVSQTDNAVVTELLFLLQQVSGPSRPESNANGEKQHLFSAGIVPDCPCSSPKRTLV